MLNNIQQKLLKSISGIENVIENLPLTPTEGAAEKKRLLIEMAERGEPRPNQKKHYLGSCLADYVCDRKTSFDPEFNLKIRALAPHWFKNIVEIKKQNQNVLFELAFNQKPRPTQKTKYGILLSNYCNKNSRNFDLDFVTEILKIRPDWFQKSRVDCTKEILLKMAKKGEPRPNKTTYNTLRNLLVNYTKKGTKHIEFDKQIREIAPHWFEDTTLQKKTELLELAKKGGTKPIRNKNILAEYLKNYTSPKSDCYDSEFTLKMKSLVPHWFQNRVSNNINILLNSAKNGDPQPHFKTSLGSILASYINKSHKMYQPEFDLEIHNIAPHWFKSKGAI